MSTEQDVVAVKKEAAAEKQIWQKEPHPIVSVCLVVAVIALMTYWAYKSEYLPIKPPSEFEIKLGQMARKSHGDFSKLPVADQEYLNKATSGRGGMAIGEYLKHHKVD